MTVMLVVDAQIRDVISLSMRVSSPVYNVNKYKLIIPKNLNMLGIYVFHILFIIFLLRNFQFKTLKYEYICSYQLFLS